MKFYQGLLQTVYLSLLADNDVVESFNSLVLIFKLFFQYLQSLIDFLFSVFHR